MRICILVLMTLLFSAPLQAQLSKTQVTDLLSNGAQRNWQYAKYSKSLGAACKDTGQLFIFFKDGHLQRKRCVNGKPEFTAITWKLIPVGATEDGEWQLQLSEPIEIGNGNYLQTMRVDLPQGEMKKPRKEMILRVLPDCKVCLEQKITLTSID